MKIKKGLNNNVAVIDDNGEEKIVMGRGICYHRQPGDRIDETKIDKIFTLKAPEQSRRFQELIQDIPLEYVILSEEIVAMAKANLRKELNDSIYIALLDHIHGAVERTSRGLFEKNPMLWDIRRFYREEFDVGIKALEIIQRETGCQLPEDEAGYIAFHLMNAERGNQDEGSVFYEITNIMQDISNLIKDEFQVSFDEDSVYYYRFITHLKSFAIRLVEGKFLEDPGQEELHEMIQRKYPNAYRCTEIIDQYTRTHCAHPMTQEEKVCLAIHIQRVVYT